jgi:hypothetical protein
MPVTGSLDLAVMRSWHVMAANKTAREMWGMPHHQWKKGTTLEDDILDLEYLIGVSGIFVTMDPLKITKIIFWDLVRTEGKVGSPWDLDRTTIPHLDHERVLISRMFGGEFAFDCDNLDIDCLNIGNDNNASAMSSGTQDESIFLWENNKGVNCDSNDELDVDLTIKERAVILDSNLKSLHIFKKSMHMHATNDLFLSGKLLMRKTLAKARTKTLQNYRSRNVNKH